MSTIRKPVRRRDVAILIDGNTGALRRRGPAAGAAVNATLTYSQLHTAFAATATRWQLTSMDVRVAVAVRDLGGDANTHELYAALQSEGTGVRRSLGVLYACNLAHGAGIDGKRRRPGIVTRVALTARGRELVAEFDAHHRVLSQPMAVAA